MIPATSSAPGDLEQGEPAGLLMKLRSWLLEQLDSLISRPLRDSPSEFSRARVLAGIACTMLVFTLLFHLSLLVSSQAWPWSAPVASVELGLIGTPRLFSQGFTTKEKGHGFGLHISALSAMEMKGRIECTRSEPGKGATFTLELPWTGEMSAP